MDATYQIFKVIFGLIISGVVLFVIITYISDYSQVQEDSQSAQTLKNFMKSSGDSYFTGNPIGEVDISKREEPITFNTDEPPGIVSVTGKVPVFFPVFFYLGDEVFIGRNSLDMGWWEFRYVEAMPETRIYFNPIAGDSASLVSAITSAFPSTEFFEPKVTFGFCDGSQLLENQCSGRCERDNFMLLTGSGISPMSTCTVQIPQNSRLITISQTCSPLANGYCVSLPDSQGIGTFTISGETFRYKDPVDIAAAVIGGAEKDVYGNSGATLYQYKNNVFRKELSLASRVLSARASLLAREHTQECSQAYETFQESMEELSQLLEDTGYYSSPNQLSSLVSTLTSAKAEHANLTSRGCDYQ